MHGACTGLRICNTRGVVYTLAFPKERPKYTPPHGYTTDALDGPSGGAHIPT